MVGNLENMVCLSPTLKAISLQGHWAFVMRVSSESPSHTRVCAYIEMKTTVNNIGPQTAFPVPEGILNHRGSNYLAVTLWSQDSQGARLGSLRLAPTAYIESGYKQPTLSPGQTWTKRKGAY